MNSSFEDAKFANSIEGINFNDDEILEINDSEEEDDYDLHHSKTNYDFLKVNDNENNEIKQLIKKEVIQHEHI